MIMTSLEFTGEAPFSDVYVHSVIQAPDGRRMSKPRHRDNPLDEIAEHGADACFSLLAMSSTRCPLLAGARPATSVTRWNASADPAQPDPAEGGRRREAGGEPGRGPLNLRLQRAVGSMTASIEAYDFAHASRSTSSSGRALRLVSGDRRPHLTTATRTPRRASLGLGGAGSPTR
jgi:valyl-tRNA synthetase